MEFDSPDVAKEFPGLYYEDIDEGGKGKKSKHPSMNDPNDYDDDSDKSSKKKKERKDSKKDKGYAALAGESSPDEADRPGSKSPVRVKKLKAFKLTSSSKKKEKEKEKELSSSAKSEAKAGSGGESSKKDKKHSLSVEKELKHARKLSSEEPKSSAKSLDKSLLNLVRKHSAPSSAHHSVVTVNTPSTSSAAGVVTEKPSTTSSGSSKSSRHHHPVPFSPTAAAAAASVGKEEKHKKEIIDGVKARLKLKRGSKNSLEDSTDHGGGGGAAAGSSSTSSSSQSKTAQLQQGSSSSTSGGGQQLPEDPENLAKEIKKYEALLEQSHNQIQSSKKVSKKHEEQLWELQRTLTQLKRKLRSINALSSAATIPTTHTTTATTAVPPQSGTTTTVVTVKQVKHPPPEPEVTTTPAPAILQPEKVTALEPAVAAPIPAISPPPASVEPPELIPEPVEELSHVLALTTVHEPRRGTKSPTSTTAPSSGRPGGIVVGTVQVQAEVHAPNEKQVKRPITEERDYENVIIGQKLQETTAAAAQTATSAPPTAVPVATAGSASLEKRDSESSSSSLVFENVPDSNGKSKTSSTVTSTNASASTSATTHQRPTLAAANSLDIETDFKNLHLTNHHNNLNSIVDPRIKRNSLPSNQRLQQQHDEDAPRSPPFNPFRVPLFQTDEFIALENEALIMFNQALQDQIIEEETEVEKLVKQLGEMIDENHGLLLGVTIRDLDEMDNDELVSLLETVKHENDVLHDQVDVLRSRVAQAKLEEFQLELRLKYLQEHELLEAPDSATASTPVT